MQNDEVVTSNGVQLFNSDIKTRLAETALSHVPAKGWTIDALAAAAKDLGYPSVLHGLFPGGGADLIDYFLRKSKNEMRAELEGMDLSSMRIPVKIRTACVKRLQLTAPFISKWPDALAVMAQPQNVPMSLRNLGELVDEIWYLAGDRSVDMNWYSKRAMLAGVYTSTEVYMTQDKSPDFQETWKFLDRRLQDVATFGRTTAEVSNVVQFGLRSAVGVLASVSGDFEVSNSVLDFI
ncbi:COQ9-domain-containing protein [Fimicolochytrium jonesii]|uniref:COQ9-domain-containing protein n=1 Tax=Fimicolochytrium jonesii TaxID=1396493 RepID=UPI0022FF325B|nr:COQ9-domain-containing protein [Fimicolochytrium jonesii]KAI8816795.1 COQ9-domain-containing protein [Fimicolochytrium jonesii]